MPEPSSMMLLGSGVVPVPEVVLLGVPLSVNASEGIDPRVFSWAEEGHPGDVHPTPEFSSQYSGFPSRVAAFSKVR